MSPLPYAPLRADADNDDLRSSSSPEEVSVSTVAATTVGVGHHMLKVEGYSRLKRTHGDNGSYLESSEFRAGGHTWRIRCYLNGAREEDAGFVSMFLSRAAAAAESVVHAEYEFELVHHHDTLVRWPSHVARADARPFSMENPWGIPCFISAEGLERSRFLRDDCFAVQCKVTVVEERDAEEEDAQAEDMETMGVVCLCKDDLCKRHHARPAHTFREAFARFCRSICGSAG